MVDKLEDVSLIILAPFIKEYDPAEGVAKVSIPAAIRDRYEREDRAFTSLAFKERDDREDRGFVDDISDRPNLIARFTLHETNVAADDEEVSMAKLIEKEFGPSNREWTLRKEKKMKEQRFIQDTSGWINESETDMGMRSSRDDFFTVKVDNLPEGMDQQRLMDELRRVGCNYFEKAIVPRDETQSGFKRWAFVKFRRLRWAIKFIEDYQKLIVDNMVLNLQLAT